MPYENLLVNPMIQVKEERPVHKVTFHDVHLIYQAIMEYMEALPCFSNIPIRNSVQLGGMLAVWLNYLIPPGCATEFDITEVEFWFSAMSDADKLAEYLGEARYESKGIVVLEDGKYIFQFVKPWQDLTGVDYIAVNPWHKGQIHRFEGRIADMFDPTFVRKAGLRHAFEKDLNNTGDTEFIRRLALLDHLDAAEPLETFAWEPPTLANNKEISGTTQILQDGWVIKVDRAAICLSAPPPPAELASWCLAIKKTNDLPMIRLPYWEFPFGDVGNSTNYLLVAADALFDAAHQPSPRQTYEYRRHQFKACVAEAAKDVQPLLMKDGQGRTCVIYFLSPKRNTFLLNSLGNLNERPGYYAVDGTHIARWSNPVTRAGEWAPELVEAYAACGGDCDLNLGFPLRPKFELLAPYYRIETDFLGKRIIIPKFHYETFWHDDSRAIAYDTKTTLLRDSYIRSVIGEPCIAAWSVHGTVEGVNEAIDGDYPGSQFPILVRQESTGVVRAYSLDGFSIRK